MTGVVSVHRLGAMSALFPAIPRIGTAMAVTAVLLPVCAGPLPANAQEEIHHYGRRMEAMFCLLYTSPSPRDRQKSRMPSSA